MHSLRIVRRPDARLTVACALPLCLAAALALTPASATAQTDTAMKRADTSSMRSDPRTGLRGGWKDAEESSSNLALVAHRDRPEGFFNAGQLGDFAFVNADLAFSGNYAFIGGYNGFQVWDVSNPANPTLRSTLTCPGGQGDVSVHRNLLFVSVEETRGRLDCGSLAMTDTVSTDRFRGVRIFDISDIASPRQVASVQTCRGSHTHTLVTDPKDSANVYVYVAGTSPVRPAGELAGCSGGAPDTDTATAYFRIEVIRVPLASPQSARVVSSPRIFADSASGRIAGLWKGGDHGENTQTTKLTNQCHDITVYPEMGIAAGACSGNGILLDISNPSNPRRIAEVTDPNFAYWHSATFSNDARTVIFTDEWGGGTQARCRDTDRREWGANALFTRTGRTLRPAGYYKLPASQTAVENCVAHNGSLIPVPGRDIMVQAWYQGGVSIFDFSNPAKPVEIAYFDRGPINPAELTLAGYWSAYWYNGHIYGSEIGRGLDVFKLVPSEHLSQNEIDAANLVRSEGFNAQLQTRVKWPASFSVARAYVDQLGRGNGMTAARITRVSRSLDRAEKLSGVPRRTALTQLAAGLRRDAGNARDGARVRALADAVRDLSSSRR